jgi:hypothetical protein
MAGQQCGAARVAHDDPTGWDGVRVFTVSDDPANPSPTSSRWRPCTRTAAPTITLYPSLADEGKLIVYVSSYPLRPGPTCGQVNGPPAGNDPLHKKISVIEVPLADPAAAHVIAQPPISYPR